jgi:hypothetical protein
MARKKRKRAHRKVKRKKAHHKKRHHKKRHTPKWSAAHRAAYKREKRALIRKYNRK